MGCVSRLADAHRIGRLDAQLRKIYRYGLIVIDEVGYIQFDTEAANLFFQLVSTGYEKPSIILTSNLPFFRCRQGSARPPSPRRGSTGSCITPTSSPSKGPATASKHTTIDSLLSVEVDRQADSSP